VLFVKHECVKEIGNRPKKIAGSDKIKIFQAGMITAVDKIFV
jgi:hypothetical protein